MEINLTEEQKIVLKAVYRATKGHIKANASKQTIARNIPKTALMHINFKKTLRSLIKLGLVWIHPGRRANGGATYGITKKGIKYLKQNKLI